MKILISGTSIAGPVLAYWLKRYDFEPTLAERAPAFYFDSITQLRMDTSSRTRVSPVSDAGYCPGPAVGGSTSMAVVGAYVLAGELAAAREDPTRAFAAYERVMHDYVLRSRQFAINTATQLVPSSKFQLWTMAQAFKLIGHLPAGFARAASKFGSGSTRLHDSMVLKNFAMVS